MRGSPVAVLNVVGVAPDDAPRGATLDTSPLSFVTLRNVRP